MAETDGEILRQVWHSYLPIVFRLSASEVTQLQEPDPYYLMVSRISYFPLVMEKVIKHLQRFIPEPKQSANDLWLDFDGIPLKWHYPIGLLWDLHGSESELPWNITVHFQDFPEDQLVRCNSRASIESTFMSSLKEADALKHRSQVMCSLQRKDHNQLWLGVANDKFDQFWAINRKLMEYNANEEVFRFIPFRLYLFEIEGSQQRLNLIQKLVKPKLESGENSTLSTLSALVFNTDAQQYKLIIHGIEPPPETPLQWLSEHMSYPDNFLHVCALKK